MQQTNESKTMNVVIFINCKFDWETTNKENKRKITIEFLSK